MALRHLRTTTENVPASINLNPATPGAYTEMQKVVEQDDKNNFTINKWRNKVSTDIRVRSKQKDFNYKMKMTEDVELTRLAAQKLLTQKFENVRLDEDPLSVGTDAVIFSGTVASTNEKIVVKVWNRPGKELMESKRQIFEANPELFDEVKSKCSDAVDFPAFWATRVFENLKKLRSLNVSCPTPLYCVKNILVMKREWSWKSVSVELPSADDRYLTMCSTGYLDIIKGMRNLYVAGYVSLNLDESSINLNGLLFDVGHLIPRSHPMAMEMLFKNCKRIFTFCEANGLKSKKGELPSPEATFAMVTGHAYVPTKSSSQTTKFEFQDIDLENRKAERKSARSLLRKL